MFWWCYTHICSNFSKIWKMSNLTIYFHKYLLYYEIKYWASNKNYQKSSTIYSGLVYCKISWYSLWFDDVILIYVPILSKIWNMSKLTISCHKYLLYCRIMYWPSNKIYQKYSPIHGGLVFFNINLYSSWFDDIILTNKPNFSKIWHMSNWAIYFHKYLLYHRTKY